MAVRRLRSVGERALLPAFRAVTGVARVEGAAEAVLAFPGWRTAGFASGTAALAAAILAAAQARPTRRPRVILPAYSCPDVVSAAVFTQAEVDLADTLPDSPWLDPAAVASLVTADTVAVVYPRFLGLPANGEALRDALAGSGVVLIEDSAHAFPLDERVESPADLVVFSFGRGKPLPLRSGGALLWRKGSGLSPALAAPVRDSMLGRIAYGARCLAYNIGIQPHVYWLLTEVAGLRVDAIAWRELESIEGLPPAASELLPRAIERYRRQGTRQQERLASLLRAGPGHWTDLACPIGGASLASAPLSRYPLLLPSEAERDRIFQDLREQGLGASRLYGATLAELPDVRRFVTAGPLKNASDFARRFLALPLHSDVRAADFERMTRILGGPSPDLEPLSAGPLRT